MGLLALVFYTLLFWALVQVLVMGTRQLKVKEKLPPGPIPTLIVGSLFKLGKKPHESLTQLAKIHGSLMTVKLGQVVTIVVSSSEMAKQVLQKHDESFAGRQVVDAVRGSKPNESSIAWAQQPNARWRRLRAVCNTRIFTTARLAASEDLRRKKVDELIAHVHEHGLAGRAVEVGQAAFTTVLNLIWNTIFSVDLVDPSSRSAQEIKEIIWGVMEEGGRPNIVDYFPVLRPLDPQGIRRRFASHAKKLHALLDEMIDQRISSVSTSSTSPGTGKNDFLHALLEEANDDGFRLSREDIRFLLADLFVAGAETSSATVEWTMAELLCNPNAMEKAQLELKEMIGPGQTLKESDVARLPYVQAVVKETLRLHTPVPLFLRKTLSDVEICGFMIPKNTMVTINAWAIGRNPDVWADASTFLPERFLDSAINFKGHDFELIPFGSGRRICPGLPLAHRMIHLMLGSLLHSFAWKLPDGMKPQDVDLSTKFGLTMQIAKPLHAIPMRHST